MSQLHLIADTCNFAQHYVVYVYAFPEANFHPLFCTLTLHLHDRFYPLLHTSY